MSEETQKIAQTVWDEGNPLPVPWPIPIPIPDREAIEEVIDGATDFFKPSPPPTESEKLREKLTPEMQDGIEKDPVKETLLKKLIREAAKSEIRKGCICADVERTGDPTVDWAATSTSGSHYDRLIIKPDGNWTVVDAEFKGQAKRHASLKNSVIEVEPTFPKNATEEQAFRNHLLSKVQTWQDQAKIAKDCGHELVVIIPHKPTYDWFKDVGNVGKDSNIKIRHAYLVGTHDQVTKSAVLKVGKESVNESHHPVSVNELEQAGVLGKGKSVTRGNAPAIVLPRRQHEDTPNYGSSIANQNFRKDQADRIKNGEIRDVYSEAIRDVINLSPGIYNDAIRQLTRDAINRGFFQKVNDELEKNRQSSIKSPQNEPNTQIQGNPLAAYWEANRERPPEIPIEVRAGNLAEQQSSADLQQERTQVSPEAAEPVVLSQVPPEVIAVQDQAIAEQPQAPELNPILSPLEFNEAQPDLESQRQETLGQTTNPRDTNAQNRIIPSDISNRPDIFTPPQSLEELAQQSANQIAYQTPAVLKQMEGIVNAYRASEPPNITSQHIDQAEHQLGTLKQDQTKLKNRRLGDAATKWASDILGVKRTFLDPIGLSLENYRLAQDQLKKTDKELAAVEKAIPKQSQTIDSTRKTANTRREWEQDPDNQLKAQVAKAFNEPSVQNYLQQINHDLAFFRGAKDIAQSLDRSPEHLALLEKAEAAYMDGGGIPNNIVNLVSQDINDHSAIQSQQAAAQASTQAQVASGVELEIGG